MKKIMFAAGIATVVAGALAAVSAIREDDICICDVETEMVCDCCDDATEASK